MDIALEDAVSNFKQYYLPTADDLKDINKNYFEKIISFFSKDINFNEIILEALTNKTTFSTMACPTMCVIKVAILEMFFGTASPGVIINEYVEISKYFCDQKSVSFINAVLDRISKNRTCNQSNVKKVPSDHSSVESP
jgi:N utilization substance protein B